MELAIPSVNMQTVNLQSLSFLVKVLLISIGLSFAIKYLAPALSIPPTNLSALIGITVPPLAMALWLAYQSQATPSQATPSQPAQSPQTRPSQKQL